MPLLNYTTSVSAEKTIAEIEKALAAAGARAIMKHFDEKTGQPIELAFKIESAFGMLFFRLPAKIDQAQKILTRQATQGKIPRRFANDREQAIRVAWRIIREWVLSQLALVELEQADFGELFLAFTQGDDGRTLYERFGEIIQGKGFPLLFK